MKIVVIKIGTNVLTTPEGKLDLNTLRTIINQVSDELDQNKRHCVLVTSGAITCGSEKLQSSPSTIQDRQAAASVGQILLMNEYAQFFAQRSYIIGQLLLTKSGLKNKQKKANALGTLHSLLKQSVVPIINENDSVATEEIENDFSDNDALACEVAKLLDAETLILLTDTGGLYDADPKRNPDAKLIPVVTQIDKNILNLASFHAGGNSKGGMPSKLNSAKRATESGIDVIIADGNTGKSLQKIFQGKSCGTLFPRKGKK